MNIIAEISGNHGGYLDKACELIEVAAECGCDYAKFQYYHPREMYDAENERLYSRLAIPRDWLGTLFDAAGRSGIGLFASVFSSDGVADLVEYSPPYFKIASPQSTWLPTRAYKEIVKAVPESTPIIFSADERDGARMLSIVRPHRYIKLYCPLGHPPKITDDNYAEFLDFCYDGFSDHTSDLTAPLAFAMAGAEWIEKHLKLDGNCVDAAFSASPDTMARLCEILN